MEEIDDDDDDDDDNDDDAATKVEATCVKSATRFLGAVSLLRDVLQVLHFSDILYFVV